MLRWRILRLITFALIVFAFIFWVLTFIAWYLSDPGFDQLNYLAEATLTTLFSLFGWLGVQGVEKSIQKKANENVGLQRGNAEIKPVAFANDSPDPFKPYLLALYEDTLQYINSKRLIKIEVVNEKAQTSTPRQGRILPERIRTYSGGSTQSSEFKSTQEAMEYFNNSLLLLGDPGSGKTIALLSCLLSAIEARLIDPSKPLPIIAPIATWDNLKDNFTEWLSEASSLDVFVIREHYLSGKLILFLDGLDEIENNPHTKSNEQTNRFIDLLNNSLGGNKVLVTCRTQSYLHVNRKINVLGAASLEKLSEEQIAQFLVNHQDLLHLLKKDRNLMGFANTPLTLELLISSWDAIRTNLNISANTKPSIDLDDLIRQFVEQRFKYETKHLKNNISLKFIYFILGNLAVYSIFKNTKPKRMKILRFQTLNESEDTPDPILYVYLKSFLSKLFPPKRKSNLFFNAFDVLQLTKNFTRTKEFIQVCQRLSLIVLDTNKQFTYFHQVFKDHFAVNEVKKRLDKLSRKKWLYKLSYLIAHYTSLFFASFLAKGNDPGTRIVFFLIQVSAGVVLLFIGYNIFNDYRISGIAIYFMLYILTIGTLLALQKWMTSGRLFETLVAVSNINKIDAKEVVSQYFNIQDLLILVEPAYLANFCRKYYNLDELMDLVVTKEGYLKNRAREVLYYLGTDATPAVIKKLRSKEYIHVWRAAFMLGMIGDDKAASALVDVYKNLPKWKNAAERKKLEWQIRHQIRNIENGRNIKLLK